LYCQKYKKQKCKARRQNSFFKTLKQSDLYAAREEKVETYLQVLLVLAIENEIQTQTIIFCHGLVAKLLFYVLQISFSSTNLTIFDRRKFLSMFSSRASPLCAIALKRLFFFFLFSLHRGGLYSLKRSSI
jgi:hypothetical protein